MADPRILLTDDAARDLDEIYARVNLHGSWREADSVLGRLDEAFTKVSAEPASGSHPPELLDLGVRDYRQACTGDYRLIYRSTGGSVYVLLIVDGRRDLRSLLERRLLEA